MGMLKLWLTAIAGMILGIAIMLAVQSHVRADSSTTAPPAAVSPTTRGLAAARDLVLEARLNRLEARMTDAAGVGAPAPVRAVDPAPIDRQAGLEDTRRAFEQRVAAHAAAPRNAAWATATEHAIAETLTKNANDRPQSFALEAVDCRTTTCVARMRWASEDAARADVRAVVENADVPCARQIALPEATAGGAYEASLLFDCAR